MKTHFAARLSFRVAATFWFTGHSGLFLFRFFSALAPALARLHGFVRRAVVAYVP